MDYIIIGLAHIAELIIELVFCDRLFEKKYNTLKICIIAFTLFIIPYVSFFAFSVTLLNLIISFVTYFWVMKICYVCSFRNSIIYCLFLISALSLSEFVPSALLVGNVEPITTSIGSFYNKVLYVVFSRLVLFVFSQIFAIIIDRTNKYNKIYLPLLLIPLTTLASATIFFLMTNKYPISLPFRIAITIASLVLFSISVFSFIYCQNSTEKEQRLKMLEQEKQQAKYDNDYMQVLEHQNNEINMLLHDTKNHYLAISNMNSAEEMKEYIANVLDDVQQYNIVHLTNNKMLDLLLSKYLILCQNNGVKLNVEVKTANLLYVPEADLSTIINNLMDNALESAKVSTEKEIDFSIRHINGFDTLTVSNSCDEEPTQKSGRLITTKTAKSVHGFGTKIIKKYATKNNATYEWFYDSEKHKFNSALIFNK